MEPFRQNQLVLHSKQWWFCQKTATAHQILHSSPHFYPWLWDTMLKRGKKVTHINLSTAANAWDSTRASQLPFSDDTSPELTAVQPWSSYSRDMFESHVLMHFQQSQTTKNTGLKCQVFLQCCWVTVPVDQGRQHTQDLNWSYWAKVAAPSFTGAWKLLPSRIGSRRNFLCREELRDERDQKITIFLIPHPSLLTSSILHQSVAITSHPTTNTPITPRSQQSA